MATSGKYEQDVAWNSCPTLALNIGPEQLGVTMYTVTLQCEIPEERTLTVKLPDSIQPGNARSDGDRR